jgi:hypothetical protein
MPHAERSRGLKVGGHLVKLLARGRKRLLNVNSVCFHDGGPLERIVLANSYVPQEAHLHHLEVA